MSEAFKQIRAGMLDAFRHQLGHNTAIVHHFKKIGDKIVPVDDILQAREETYGSFKDNAKVSRKLKEAIYPYYNNLSDIQIEALEYIFGKISRIVVGDPNHIDSWDDTACYATLVAEDLRERESSTRDE